MTDDLEDDLEAEIENFLLENEDLIEDDEEVKSNNQPRINRLKPRGKI